MTEDEPVANRFYLPGTWETALDLFPTVESAFEHLRISGRGGEEWQAVMRLWAEIQQHRLGRLPRAMTELPTPPEARFDDPFRRHDPGEWKP